MNFVETRVYEFGQAEIEHLTQADESMGAAIERIGKLERIVLPDVFSALVYAIISQLISAKAADTIWLRLQQQMQAQVQHKQILVQEHSAMSTQPLLHAQQQVLTPQAVNRLTLDELRGCGLTQGKAQCIIALAHSIEQGETDLEQLRCLPDDEVVAKLTAWRGIGRWTAEMVLIHGLERPDVVSWGDIAIRRGMMKLYGLSSLTPVQFEQYCCRYSPYGTVASIYLWQISFQ